MPEDSNDQSQATSEVVDLDKKPQASKTINFSKGKFLALVIGVLILVALVGFGSYNLGVQSQKSSTSGQIQKTAVKKTTETDPGVQTVNLGEEVTTKSGITVKLEEAKYDDAYEKQKNESKDYYQKNASQSAYLESDYFKNSQLDLKVSLQDNTKKTVSYSPSSFRLKDSDDVQYVASYEGDKQIYGLNAGETTRLNLNYIVPTDQKTFSLVFENVVVEFTLK